MKLTEIALLENAEHPDPMVRSFLNAKPDVSEENVQVFLKHAVKGTYTQNEDGSYDITGDLLVFQTYAWPLTTRVVSGQVMYEKNKAIYNFRGSPTQSAESLVASWSTIHTWDGITPYLDRLDLSDCGKIPDMKGFHKRFKHLRMLRMGTCTNLLSILQIPGLEVLHARWPVPAFKFGVKQQPLRIGDFVNDTLLKIPHEKRKVFDMQEMLTDAGFEQYAHL